MAELHATADGTLERQASGWYEARCVCGFTNGPFPDLETTVDELMDHAWAAAASPSNPGEAR